MVIVVVNGLERTLNKVLFSLTGSYWCIHRWKIKMLCFVLSAWLSVNNRRHGKSGPKKCIVMVWTCFKKWWWRMVDKACYVNDNNDNDKRWGLQQRPTSPITKNTIH